MSITDLIVELLENGKSVEIEGIGTLGSVMQKAHHDPATQTYYPAGRTIAFYTTTSGDNSIIKEIAERECVGTSVAQQMWKNYIDALCDKMQRTGTHTFGRLGDLMLSNGTYSFAATKGLVLNADNNGEQPLEGVRTYSHEGEDDPFAKFEENFNDTKAEADRKAAEKAEAERQAAEKAEAERIAAEKAEAERLAAEKAEAERKAAEKAEAERQAAEKAEAKRKAAEKAEADRKAAEKAEAERQAAKKAEDERKAAEKEQLKQLESIPAKETPKAESCDTEGKKKRCRWWLWLLLLLLLLLAAGGYYYYTNYYNKSTDVEATENTKHLEGVGSVNSLTYNCDMIEYSQRDMRRHSGLICQFMAEYIDEFLASHGYRSARVPMMDRIQQYSATRIEELLGPRFAVQRLIPYNDYIYYYNEPFLKEVNGRRARVTVQTELMNIGLLEQMLDNLVTELGLQPDAGAPRTAAAVQEVKQVERTAVSKKAPEETLNVYVEKGSKQGFDLIAGFYLDKATAARMSGRLHSLGCDAYIIEFNDLYYVSMGSTSTQTAADALLKHVKSWYDGDVVIKKW